MIDEIITECTICGEPITIGIYPPVCSDSCKNEYIPDCDYSTWAEKQPVIDKKKNSFFEQIAKDNKLSYDLVSHIWEISMGMRAFHKEIENYSKV